LQKWVVRGFEKHLIFYLEGDEYIEIVRLIHAARDISQILAEEE
jgi:toxin ParE1/3/4